MSTRNKYRKVPSGDKKEDTKENDIRLTAKKRPNSYIIRGAHLMLREENPLTYINLKATGNAIPTAILVSEVLRRRIKGLHQITNISNTVVEDKFEPKEEGLDDVIMTRTLSILEITLTIHASEEQKNHCGYQGPLPEKEVEELSLEQIKNFRKSGDEKREGGDRRRDDRRGDRRGGNRRGGDRRRDDRRRDDRRRDDRDDRDRRDRSYDRERRNRKVRTDNRDDRRENRGYDRDNRDRRDYRDRRDNRDNRDNRDRSGDRRRGEKGSPGARRTGGTQRRGGPRKD